MRLLVAEDDALLAHSIQKGLQQEKYQVTLCDNGEDAYNEAFIGTYDIIILDIMLPKMDGITVCQQLRHEKVYTPILILTARDRLHDKVTGLDSGADDYMVKPFAFEELLARIRSLLRRHKDVILKVDNLELNPATHMVIRAGKPIELTTKEYELLQYFMYNPNQVLSRERIHDNVWDYAEDHMSNIIDVLIRRLRNKIDKAFPKEKQLFSTVRNSGYKINDTV